jgi:hypothetical protein
MKKYSYTGKNSFTARKLIASWMSYSDPYMVVLSRRPKYLALEVMVAYLSAYDGKSRRNAFLASHGWTKNFLNLRKGSEVCNLRALSQFLEDNPRQAALLLRDTQHILISSEDRIARLRSAYGFFVGRGCNEVLNTITSYLKAVHGVQKKRQQDREPVPAPRREPDPRLQRLVARVKAIKAQRNFTEVLGRVKTLLALNTKATGMVAGVDLRHWRYLVSPLE